MVTEFGEIKPHFRTTISPLIDGVDPLKEKKYRPPGRAINPKAELIGRIHLYEGTIRTVELGGILVQVQGFMDISQTFFADGETTNQPFIGWGLRDATTNRGIWQYSDSGICCDPVYAYRCTKILEELPELSTDSDKRINDWQVPLKLNIYSV